MINKPKYIPAPTADDLERMENGESFADITAGPIEKIIKEALGEDVEEIEELTEAQAIEPPKKKRKSKKRALYLYIGIFVTVMSLIGMVFSVNFIASGIKSITDNTAQKNYFSRYIYPLVIVDVPEYTEDSKLPAELMLRTAAWDIIINYDGSKYENNYGSITVPASDLEVVATRLFGKGIHFNHQTLGDPTLYFNYNEETKSYTLPVSPSNMTYKPVVEDITKADDDIYVLKVGYYPPIQDWMPSEKKNVADKYLSYTLKKDGTNYTILSVKNVTVTSTDDSSYIFDESQIATDSSSIDETSSTESDSSSLAK